MCPTDVTRYAALEPGPVSVTEIHMVEGGAVNRQMRLSGTAP
jgi:hypothetical protein